jgi:acyl carrier protein
MIETSQRVRQVVGEILGREPSSIALESRFAEDLGADSLEVAEIVMGLEGEFDITVPDDAPEFIRTIEDAVKFVEARSVT